MKPMSLRMRLLTAFATPIALLIVCVAAFEVLQHRNIRLITKIIDARESAYDTNDAIDLVLNELRRPASKTGVAIRDVYWSELAKQLANTRDRMGELDSGSEEESVVEAAWATSADLWSSQVATPDPTTEFLLQDALADLSDGIGVLTTVLRHRLISAVDEEQALRNALVNSGIVLGIFLPVILIGFAIWSARNITRPIDDLVTLSRTIADGDLTIRVEPTGQPEIDRLGESLDQMVRRLRNLVGKIRVSRGAVSGALSAVRQTVDQANEEVLDHEQAVAETSVAIEQIRTDVRTVSEDAERLYESAHASSSAVAVLDSSTSKIASDTQSLQNEIHESTVTISKLEDSMMSLVNSASALDMAANSATQTIERIRTMVSNVESGAMESSNLVGDVSARAEAGLDIMGKAEVGMNAIRETFEQIERAISVLSEQSHSIASISGVIGDIAGETRLLSLNASIIAAQSGASGGPFGVVARQMSTLSERSAQSVKQISGIIDQVREQIEAAVGATKAGAQRVDSGAEFVQIARDQLGAMSQAAVRSAQRANEIVTSVTDGRSELDIVTKQARQTSQVASELRRATEEQGQAAERIRSSIQKIQSLAINVQESTEKQRAESNQITRVADEVDHRSQQIRDATADQRAETHRIADSLKRFSAGTDERLANLDRLKLVIDQLVDSAVDLDQSVEVFRVDHTDDAT
ncbi:MAG: methyl-accepting chemotaxis protein [Proteobacteria bacterium]|nr:methyl-accepting chemotaxis protein [Pseudomonadota bacterium]